MKDFKKAESWLHKLRDCPDCERLAICIAIDVSCGAVPAAWFAKILDGIDPAADGCRAFAKALDKHALKINFICASLLADRPLDIDDRYVRVLTIEEFITWYLHEDHRYPTPEEVKLVKKLYFEDPLGQHLEDIHAFWGGVDGRAWILSHSEFTTTSAGLSPNEAASKVNDVLGLGKPYGSEIVLVLYPNEYRFHEKQPTTLDARWDRSWYYVSYGDVDGWGRTHSCSGAQPGCRERVHPGHKGLSSGFVIALLGFVDSVVENREKLRQEAYQRLVKFVSP